MDASAVLRLLVLLVPILYFVAMPDKMLGNQTFKKRFTGIQTETMGRETSSGPWSQAAKDNPETFLIPEKDDGLTKKPKEDTIIKIYRDMDAYKGKRVIIKGLFLSDEQLKPRLGGIDTVVYRFLINCCAADAIPLPIALVLEETKTFKKDQWVQVDGTFEVREINGNPMPVISKPVIKPIQEPAVPYMF
jgi:putative membrane protein